ncbi:hypothetical protein [Rhodopirellula bahusiensis]|uniref:Uncharacterized protein n=2 Tax=Rhodopirellula bahusiensis TaxID=2014065 RepID=A0A2G1WA65_9BACT|nr:hypothetical protein [Rhodopirellula bahusiensis]PHQ35918.1 hypothetical protein CEE69_06850 [Rhodopirellula bahusiensis]
MISVALISGCVSTNTVSEPAIDAVSQPKFLTQLDGVDAIQIEELMIANRSDIGRFIQLCRNARWAPFAATMPGNIETIRFMSDGIEIHQLFYAGGWLIDASGDGVVRFGTIHSDDGDWIDENVDTQLMLLRNAL